MNDRARSRAQEIDVLRAELDRTYALLADALVLTTKLAEAAGYRTTPEAMMAALGAARGMRLDRPAWLEAVQRRAEELERIRLASEPPLGAECEEPAPADEPEPVLSGEPRLTLVGTPEPPLGEEPRLDPAAEQSS